MKKLFSSALAPLVTSLINLLLAYVTYFIARVVYMLVNLSYFTQGLTFSQLMEMFGGGLLFDTSAIIYTNLLWIVMMLFPLWAKETPLYHKICRGLFVTVNGLAFIANLADSVYFPYTLRRTTTSVFKEFDNESNLGDIVGTELINHWYLVVIAAVVIFALYKLYVMPRTDKAHYPTTKSRVKYGLIQLACLAGAAPLCVGGCRTVVRAFWSIRGGVCERCACG